MSPAGGDEAGTLTVRRGCPACWPGALGSGSESAAAWKADRVRVCALVPRGLGGHPSRGCPGRRRKQPGSRSLLPGTRRSLRPQPPCVHVYRSCPGPWPDGEWPAEAQPGALSLCQRWLTWLYSSAAAPLTPPQGPSPPHHASSGCSFGTCSGALEQGGGPESWEVAWEGTGARPPPRPGPPPPPGPPRPPRPTPSPPATSPLPPIRREKLRLGTKAASALLHPRLSSGRPPITRLGRAALLASVCPSLVLSTHRSSVIHPGSVWPLRPVFTSVVSCVGCYSRHLSRSFSSSSVCPLPCASFISPSLHLGIIRVCPLPVCACH